MKTPTHKRVESRESRVESQPQPTLPSTLDPRPSTNTDALLPRWEHFEHKADVGVRGIGPTKAAAFEQVAVALLAVTTNPKLVRPSEQIEIHCAAPSDELLLVEWLNALIFQMATRKILFSRFDVSIDGRKLIARVSGEKVDVARHEPAVEIKGATYTELSVRQDAAGCWVAQCVVDV